MATSRDAFIAELIAALQENEALARGGVPTGHAPLPASCSSSSSSSSSSSPQSFFSLTAPTTARATDAPSVRAHRAYEALQFDFPLVHDDDVRALALAYRDLVNGGGTDGGNGSRRPLRPEDLALTRIMLSGVEYLTDAATTTTTRATTTATPQPRGSEAHGLLAAALLLLVPAHCLRATTSDDPQATTHALLSKLVLPAPASPASFPTGTDLLRSLEARSSASATTTTTIDCDQQDDVEDVEILAAEEDPDDLSLVYEGHLPRELVAPRPHRRPRVDVGQRQGPSIPRKLKWLASMTYSSLFAAIAPETWAAWALDDAILAIVRGLLPEQQRQQQQQQQQQRDDQDDDDLELFGDHGEWPRYVFVLRDRLLRFPNSAEATLGTLCQCIESLQAPPPPTSAASSGAFASGDAVSAQQRALSPSHPLRVLFRVLAELAVSKEFNATSARRGQHLLASAIQRLLPRLQVELQRLAPFVPRDDFALLHGDFVLMLLQLARFSVDASTAAPSAAVQRLQDAGLLRQLLAFLPPTDDDAPTPGELAPWLAPLLRLLGLCAIWDPEFAAYVVRIPRLAGLLPRAHEALPAEVAMLWLAAHQHRAALPLGALPSLASAASVENEEPLWSYLCSERVFPSTCGDFLTSMRKLADALYVLECISRALHTLRPEVRAGLQGALRRFYASAFAKSFEYPGFCPPSPGPVASSQLKDEPEPPPPASDEPRAASRPNDPENSDEDKARGRAEALQFVALRNRLRHCIKGILLVTSSSSPSSLSFASAASSKLD